MAKAMQERGKRLAVCLVLAGLPGCAGMGPQIEDWPELSVVEHHVPHQEMRDRCARYAGFGSFPLACAEVTFDTGRCDIWFSTDFPPSAFAVQHERLHCAGHDHEGESSLRDALALHRSRLSAVAGAGYTAP